MPFHLEQRLDQSPIGPYIAFIPALKNLAISGTATGIVDFGGNLSDVDANGKRGLTYKNLSGTAKFTQLSLQIQDSPLAATEPVSIRFNTREIVFESAHFAGGGSNMTIAGTKALADDASRKSIDQRSGKPCPRETWSSRTRTHSLEVSLPSRSITPDQRKPPAWSEQRMSRMVQWLHSSAPTAFRFDRIKGRMIFTANKAQIEKRRDFLGVADLPQAAALSLTV